MLIDPYFSTKEVDKGAGIGLAVVHGIVKNHDGSISVYSEPNKGTTVKVLFPVIEEKPVREKVISAELPTGNENVLFVDDEKALIKMGQMTLEKLGYHVDVSTNHFLNAIKGGRPERDARGGTDRQVDGCSHVSQQLRERVCPSFLSARPLDLVVLNHPRQPDLGPGRKLADLIEKNSSVVGTPLAFLFYRRSHNYCRRWSVDGYRSSTSCTIASSLQSCDNNYVNVYTIDEIVFQTNLPALNAAIGAARSIPWDNPNFQDFLECGGKKGGWSDFFAHILIILYYTIPSWREGKDINSWRRGAS